VETCDAFPYPYLIPTNNIYIYIYIYSNKQYVYNISHIY